MTDWNNQASRNNNVHSTVTMKQESMENKRIQLNVQEENGIENGQNVKPQVRQE
ncbi:MULTISPECIES: hypothetical protein [Bacillus]|uniref:hypothetical protein n=1 Tax=Bacillus TaxID=1386 RepID=UPI00159688B6|nr:MULTISPECIES: hypothetical protein [Bacillus]